jgi:hypothetical protein
MCTLSLHFFSVTSTPQRSQMIPLYRILLYFPQAHSKSFTGPKFFHRKRPSRSGLCVRWLIVSGFKTSPLDSFKIDSGEASPIDILLNLLQDSYLYYSIIHHSSYY